MKQYLMFLTLMSVTTTWAQKTITTEGWDGATAKEVWSNGAVSWSIDWVTRYSDDTVERTRFTMSSPRGVKTLTEWNIPSVIFYEESSVDFSNLQVNLVSSTNESRTSDGATFSWVNEKREISDKMTIHTWFDNTTVTPFLNEVLDKNRVWVNKWEAQDPFDCKVSYKNQEYLFSRKANAPEVSQKDSVTYDKWNSYSSAIRSDMLSYKVGDYIQNVPAIYSTGPGNYMDTFMEKEWGWLYDVKQTVANNLRQNGFVYIWSLHFSNGILPVVVSSGSTPDWNFSYFEYGASPLYNSAVWDNDNGKWKNAIASDDADMMRWREAGPVMDEQDADVAKQIGWDDGHGESVFTNRYTIDLTKNHLYIFDSYNNGYNVGAWSNDDFKKEWGELVDVKQTLANDRWPENYVYVLSLHFSNGYVLPAISVGAYSFELNYDYCEKTPNMSYNSAYYDKTEYTWKNAIAYDDGPKMCWAREGKVLAKKKYDIANNQNWDEGHGTSIYTNRYDIQIASSSRITVNDSYNSTYIGSWDGGVPRSCYDTEYRDDIRTPSAYAAYLKVGKYGKIVWNGQEITAIDTESNIKELTSEECKVPTWEFQIVPDEGYEVDSVGLNNLNITSYVTDNVLTLRTFARDIHLEFRFVKKSFTNIEELEGLQDGDVFTAMANGGTLRFKVLSAADKTCQVGTDSRSDGLVTGGGKWNGVIPSKVTGSDDQEYTVIGIGNRAFYEYDGFESFTLPATLKQISEGAFMRCHDLKYITIPAGVTTMGNYIFNGQEKLTEVVSLIENPYSIDESTFAGKYGNKATLVVPAGKKAAYQNTDGWKLFTRIVEMKSGDADGNENVDEQDVNMVKDYIMTGKEPEGFVRQNADTQSTNKITVVDIVNILNIIKSKK